MNPQARELLSRTGQITDSRPEPAVTAAQVTVTVTTETRPPADSFDDRLETQQQQFISAVIQPLLAKIDELEQRIQQLES